MKSGDSILCRLFDGNRTRVVLEERVVYDPAAYQHEAGWYAYPQKLRDLDEIPSTEWLFLSDEGTLYAYRASNPSNEWSGYDKPVGYSLQLRREAKAFDRMIEALEEGGA